MAANEEETSATGFDGNEHQQVFVYTLSADQDAPERPAKRRRVGGKSTSDAQKRLYNIKFERLLNGLESDECVDLRQELFTRYWARAEEQILSILGESNKDTLKKVTSFVQDTRQIEGCKTVPAGFIVSGPNIASQDLLFEQLSERLKTDINGPVVTLRSGAASNLKSVLKQLIRDVTNQRVTDDDKGFSFRKDGRKLLSYDLEIVHGYVRAHGSRNVVVAFQDSEAFDTSLLSDLVIFFSSWTDRIPFVLLFGVATSIELFHERLSRAASRCLLGAQFDVEQTSSILDAVFHQVVAGSTVPLRLGSRLISALVERQNNHLTSIRAFIAELKYAYMSHFYANPLSVLMEDEREPKAILKILQPEHLDAIRMLPSFKKFVERLIDRNDVIIARGLLRDDTLLLTEIEKVLVSTTRRIIKLLRTVSVLSSAAAGPVDKIKLYIEAFRGTINDSDFVQAFLASMKLMLPNELVRFLGRFTYAVENGNLELAFEDWTGVELGLMNEIIEIKAQLVSIIDASTSAGESVRSQYTTHSRGARTTVIAQKIHLSSEQATLSKQDIQYTRLIDRLSVILEKFFTFEDPQNMFLNESWLYDFITPHKEVFAPRPRFAVEQALSAPHEYLPGCKDTGDSLSSVKPTTTILYQMYLESGSLVNVSDIWTAFFSLVGSEEREAYDERTALMLFYRGLAELKQLGMIKQSKKKVDHLAKTLWKGI